MKASRTAKRRRKAAGRKVAPLIATPAVPCLTDAEWQPFLRVLSFQPQPTLVRNELDRLMMTYLGVLEAEATSPSSREVVEALGAVARRAHEFAQGLRGLEIRVGNEGDGRFNTANEAAADILAKISTKGGDRSALDAAIRANEALASAGVREAKKLAEDSRKGRRTYGEPTARMLRCFVEILRDNGLVISLPPKWGDPSCVLSRHFLQITLTRAKTLKQPEWACKEIESVLMLSQPVFLGRLRQATQAPSDRLLPI